MINFHVLKMELQRSFKSLLGWTLSIGIFMYIVLIIYPMVEDILASATEEMVKILLAFGGIPTNEVEYLALEGGMLLQIFGSVYAALTGFSIINLEEKEQTSDFICSLPVSKSTFFFTKLLAGALQMLIFTIAITIFCLLGFLTLQTTVNLSNFFIYMLLFLALLLMIYGLGFSLSCFVQGTKSALALIIPLPLYLLTVISSFSKNNLLQKLKYFSPFTFSDPLSYLITKEGFEYISFTIFTSITVIFLIFAFFAYQKKEFTS
ncbi:MAG: ABC transporter permease subunit [Bacilli bacterium]|nr:ABC transporter permease subunit [Bacilli bacterium]